LKQTLCEHRIDGNEKKSEDAEAEISVTLKWNRYILQLMRVGK
jgi:hypothetical protein